MLKFVLSLSLLICSLAYAGDAVIFSGNDVKTLKPNIDLFGSAKIMSGSIDPSSGGGVAAPIGSLYLSTTAGVYRKVGAGNAAWNKLQLVPVDLTSDVTGVLPIANGGTGKSSYTTTGSLVHYNGSILTEDSDLRWEASGDLYRNKILFVTGAVETSGSLAPLDANGYAIQPANQLLQNIYITSGTPITDNDVWANSLSASVFFNDSVTASSITGAGMATHGTYTVLSGVPGKTIDKYSLNQGVTVIDSGSTGGTVTNFAAYNTRGVLNLGGVLNITNYYGYKYENALGFSPANEWGVFVEGAVVENYLEKSLAIGTTSKKVSNSSVGFEIGGTSKALRLPVLTTAQKNALTPLAGMQVYDSTLGKISVYNGSSWKENVFGVVPLADGGSNKAMTASAGSVLYSDADSFEMSGVGVAGQALVSGGTGSPTWFAPTAGNVLFAGTSGVLSENSSLTWDNANNRLIVGGGDGAFTVHGSTKGSRLSVSGQGGSNAYEVAFHKHSNTLSPLLSFVKSQGSEASPSIVVNGDILAELNFLGYDGVDYEYGAKIESVVDGVPGSNDMPAALNFYTVPDGGFTPARAMKLGENRVVTLDAYGLGILHSSAAGVLSSSAVSLTADVSGVLPIANGGTNNGSLGVTNGGICYADGSKLMMSAAGSANQILQSNGAAAPSWISTLSIAQGGTNNGSLAVTAGGVLYTDGSKVMNVGAGTAGQILVSNAGSAPSWNDREFSSSNLTLAASGSISISTTAFMQMWLIDSSGGAVTLSTTPFGATDPVNGAEITLIGNDDADTVTIPANDAANGVLGYDVTLASGQTAVYKYNATLDRFVIKSTSN